MVYRNPKEGGIRQPMDLRLKVGGVPPFEGMSRPKDPSAMRDTQAYLLENIRRTSRGMWIERGGQTKLNTIGIGSVEGIFDAGDIGASQAIVWPSPPIVTSGLYVPAFTFAPFVPPGVRACGFFDGSAIAIDADSVVNANIYNWTQALIAADGNFYIGYTYNTSGGNRVIELRRNAPRILPSTAFSAVTLSAAVFAPYVSDILEYSGAIYVAIVGGNNINDTGVYKDNGAGVLTLEDGLGALLTSSGVVGLGRYGADLYASYGKPGTNPTIKKRSGGVWSAVASPSGVVTGIVPHALAEFNGKLWVYGRTYTVPGAADTGTVLLSWDGANWTLERTLPATTAGSIGGLCVFNSFLYYTYTSSAGGSPESIGKVSAGGVFTEPEATNYDPTSGGGNGASMVVFNNKLHLIYAGRVFVSNGLDTTTYTPFAGVAGSFIEDQGAAGVIGGNYAVIP